MTTPRMRYYAGEGFENETRRSTLWRWLSVLLVIVGAASVWYLNSYQRPTGYLLVTADQDSLPVFIDLASNGAVTPALIELSGADSLTVSLRLEDQLTVPSFYRLQPQPRETLRVHFELQSLQVIPQTVSDQTSTSVRTNLSTTTFDTEATQSVKVTDPFVSQTTAGELLLPPSDTPEMGIYLRSNLIDVKWHYGDRIYQAEGRQLIIQAAGEHSVTITPELPGYQFLPGSLKVVPAELHDPYLYFHGQPRSQLYFEVKSEPVDVAVLLNGKELGRTPLVLKLNEDRVNLKFASPPGFFIPPPVQLSEIDNGTVVTVHLIPVASFEWNCSGDNSAEMGYVMPEVEVVIDNEGERYQSEGKWFWELGPQFLSKRPHGSRALICEFTLPEYDLEQQLFHLKISGRDSGKNYPFTFRNHCTLTVRVNGSTLLEEVEVTGSELTAGDPGWDVSRYLNSGTNRIVVQVGEGSLRYFLLNDVRVEAVATSQ